MPECGGDATILNDNTNDLWRQIGMDTPDLTKQLLALADHLTELGLSELTVRKEDGERVRIVVGDEFTQLRQDYKRRRD